MDFIRSLLAETWTASLAGDAALLDAVSLTGRAVVLPSTFPVTAVATAAIAAASLAAAEHLATRAGVDLPEVTVDTDHACASVLSERAVSIDGGQDDAWDPLAGDYRTVDGWVRLHTNYPWHRSAALQALECAATREAVKDAVAAARAEEVESAVVGRNGCAAAMRDAATWFAHEQGRAVAALPLVGTEVFGSAGPRHDGAPASPMTGVRVLDLTRVIAGPVASKVMAAHGAEVLRIDPPGFDDVPALVADTTVGKRAAALDLSTTAGRDALLRLVADADVVVHGYRPGALSALGLSDEILAGARPGLVIGRISAWGRSGPWQQRRGFDSLVQMAGGIAEEGMRIAGARRPTPLPCQLLDHASGWLLAAGLTRALTARNGDGHGRRVTVTLARTARWLQDLPRVGDPAVTAPTPDDREAVMEEHTGALGVVRLVSCPGTVGGAAPRWARPPTALGAHQPNW